MAIHKWADLVPEEYLARAEKLSTTQLSDGMVGQGYYRNNVMDADVKPVDVKMRFLGTAAPVETIGGDLYPMNLLVYDPHPGYVLCFNTHNYKDCACIGDLMTRAASLNGYKGLVFDGYVRDRLGMIELGFPVFSRGFMPNAPTRVANPGGEINVPTTCAGAQIKPGDLVMGDADGVIVIPREIIPQVLEKAEAKAAYEVNRERIMDAYEKGEDLGLMPDWVPAAIKEHTVND